MLKLGVALDALAILMVFLMLMSHLTSGGDIR